jgi:hypothetical protein
VSFFPAKQGVFDWQNMEPIALNALLASGHPIFPESPSKAQELSVMSRMALESRKQYGASLFLSITLLPQNFSSSLDSPLHTFTSH